MGSHLATGVATNSYNDGTVVAGVTYYYYTVKASNSSGDSATSNQDLSSHP